MDTKRPQGWRNNGVDQLVVTLSVTTTSVASSTFSVAGTFDRAFSVTPLILGTNSSRAGVGVSAVANATAIQVYINGGSPSIITDGTVVVTVSLDGKLA